MPFGVAPFVGLDSLVRSRNAQRRMDPFYQPEEPLDPWTGAPLNTHPVSPDLGPGMPVLGETEGLTQQAQPRRGFFGRLGQRLGSRRGLSGIASGLAAGLRGQNAGESLLLGFSGGLQGNLAARSAQEAAEAERSDKERSFGLQERQVANQEAITAQKYAHGGEDPTTQMQNYKYLVDVLKVDPAQARYQVWGPSGPAETANSIYQDLPWQTRPDLTPEQIEYAKKHPVNAGSGQAPQFNASDAALIAEFKERNPGTTDSDAVLAIRSGQFGAPPRITSINTWARDAVGPIYITPDGKLSYTAFDKKTGVKNQPWMVPTERDWGYPQLGDGMQSAPHPLDGLIRNE
jgi:hypothetical protein